MKLNEKANEILERYLLGVRRQILGKESEDIAAELRSHILDLLEERYPDNEAVTPEELEPVLLELGSPTKVAMQYGSNQYLIGPQIFPLYWLLLRIITAVVAGALLISFIVSAIAGAGGATYIGLVFQSLAAMFNGVLMTAAVMTLIFAIIERSTNQEGIRKELEDGIRKGFDEFKIADLPELPKNGKPFDRLGTIIEVVISSLGLVFLGYLLQHNGAVPIFFNGSSSGEMFQIFAQGFVSLLPIMIGIGSVEIVAKLFALGQDSYTPLTRWWLIITKVANIVVLGLLINNRPLLVLKGGFLDLSGITTIANPALLLALGIAIIVSTIEIITMIVKEIAGKNSMA